MIKSLWIVLRIFHARDFVIAIKAVEARNQESEYAESDGTMFTFCFWPAA